MASEKGDWHGISLRLTGEELEELDRLTGELQRRAKGAKITRTGAAKLAHDYGIAQLKRELTKPQ